jgi:hypothetical protein
MRPRRVVVVVLLVAVVGTTATVAGPPPEVDADPRVESPDPAVVVQVNLTAGGDARWTVTSKFAIGNDTSRGAFEAMVADVESGTPPAGAVGYSAASFQEFADRVEAGVNRSSEMAIRDPEWEGTVANDTATLSLSFTWTNFARTGPGSQVVLGDVFDVESAWFSSVAPDQRLVINPPSGYLVEDSDLARPFDDGSVRFDGPANLTAQNVSIVYSRSQVVPPTEPTPTPGTSTPPNGTPEGDRSGSGLVIVGGGLLLVALLVAVVVFVRGQDPFDDGSTTAGDGGTASAADTGADSTGTTDPTGRTDPTGTDPAERTAEADDGTDDEAGESSEEDDGIEEELLSDEERVERLLESNGGRMKQANIVSETGWSNAKVSQLLSSMDDEDRIDKLRIGRENLITLPDEDVGDFE